MYLSQVKGNNKLPMKRHDICRQTARRICKWFFNNIFTTFTVLKTCKWRSFKQVSLWINPFPNVKAHSVKKRLKQEVVCNY